MLTDDLISTLTLVVLDVPVRQVRRDLAERLRGVPGPNARELVTVAVERVAEAESRQGRGIVATTSRLAAVAERLPLRCRPPMTHLWDRMVTAMVAACPAE